MALSQLQLDELLVSKLLSAAANEQFAKGKIAKDELASFAQSIKELSARYVEWDKEVDFMRPFTPQDAKAYALYFTPINFAKIQRLLSEIPAHFWDKPLRVMDFGCGPGTATLACLIAAYVEMSSPVTPEENAKTKKKVEEAKNYTKQKIEENTKKLLELVSSQGVTPYQAGRYMALSAIFRQ